MRGTPTARSDCGSGRGHEEARPWWTQGRASSYLLLLIRVVRATHAASSMVAGVVRLYVAVQHDVSLNATKNPPQALPGAGSFRTPSLPARYNLLQVEGALQRILLEVESALGRIHVDGPAVIAQPPPTPLAPRDRPAPAVRLAAHRRPPTGHASAFACC